MESSIIFDKFFKRVLTAYDITLSHKKIKSIIYSYYTYIIENKDTCNIYEDINKFLSESRYRQCNIIDIIKKFELEESISLLQLKIDLENDFLLSHEKALEDIEKNGYKNLLIKYMNYINKFGQSYNITLVFPNLLYLTIGEVQVLKDLEK